DRLREAADLVVSFMKHEMEVLEKGFRPTSNNNVPLDMTMMATGMCSLIAGRTGSPKVAASLLRVIQNWRRKSHHSSSVELAIALVGAGKLNEAAESLQTAAFKEADPYAMWFHIFPPFRHLNGNRTYQELLRKLRLSADLYR